MKKQPEIFDVTEYLKTATCVLKIREAVSLWKTKNYKGITDTTRELLNYWFYNDHILFNRTQFKYHKAQQEAIETLIYIFEIEKIRNRKDLFLKYAIDLKNVRMPVYDDFAKFCIKMATGTGKTKVMSLAIVWQYFNAIKEDNSQFAKNFLILAPNVIVFERLKTDFENGKIFKTDPLIPKHFNYFWDMNFYMRGDSERASSDGALYLTNIQQFYDRENNSASHEPEQMTAILGSPPPSQKLEITDFDERISKRDGLLMVLNDEAHHTHDEENEWNNSIRKLNTNKNIISQLDFSATPRYAKGSLFEWTISDYPIKQAILDGIVKRPIKGISKIEEKKTDNVAEKYEGFLIAGVNRWKEYKEQLQNLNKNPLLFIMMNTTKEADDIQVWLSKRYPKEFGGDKTLVIHTDNSGDVSKKDLDLARKTAREVDEDKSPVNAIVSVLMLREGWDVQNVTVVVGLRPMSSKNIILPEQAIGRGLRLMFRNVNTNYRERVDVLGSPGFIKFIEELEKLEELTLDTFEVGKDKLRIITIMPMEEKKEFDIGLPEITPLIRRKKSLAEEIAKLDVNKFKFRISTVLDDNKDILSFEYLGYDVITDEQVIKREYQLTSVQTAEEVIGYYAKKISDNIKLPSQFASLVPKIKEFFEYVAFGKKVNLEDSKIVKAISNDVVYNSVPREFETALKKLIIVQNEPEIINISRFLSETNPFLFSQKVLEAKKTIFNLVACDNGFELDFARFLEKSKDIKSFAKLPIQFGFSIQYTDASTNIRNYFPDFIAVTIKDDYWLIETKGREDIDVKNKDNAARNWCEKVSTLTDTNWNYLKVPEKEFDKLNPDSFEDLVTAL
ncbi:MAG: uncharacterized protein HW421_2132 [Ignavibacteria bacterium]|nr:uncharacterized protein [Ignavibacteria bacterium]